MQDFSYKHSPGNSYAPFTPEHRVYEIAQEYGKAAASWVETSTCPEKILKGIDAGDPEVLDGIRTPDLSGEYVNDYTEDRLMADVGWVPDDGTDLRDKLAEQYLREVSEAFWSEVERAARYQVGESS